MQPASENMEKMDTVDKITPIYGGVWTPYHHMCGVDVIYDPFESVGCAFESYRGYLLLHLIKRETSQAILTFSLQLANE